MKRLLIWIGILLCCGVAWAATTTTNYGLYKPSVGDTNWGALINGNFDDIDTQMKANEDAASLNTSHRTDNTQAHSDYLLNNASDSTSGVLTASGFVGDLTGNADTATYATALAANGGDCDSGNFPLGVDASGAVETCIDVWTESENTSAGYAPLVSPSFTTPTLGVASATSINKVAITAPATSATLTIADGKTLTVTNTVDIDSMTDEYICNYEATGTKINCDIDPASLGGAETNSLETVMTGALEHEIPLGTSANTATYTALPTCSGATNALTYNTTTHAIGCNTIAGGAHDAVTLAGQDYLTLATQEITANLIKGSNVNWASIDQLIQSANVNWTNIELLVPINSASVNWLTTVDLTTDGAVLWGNIAEGELADSTVVSADIKNGTIVTGDLSATAGITAAQTAITAGRSLTWSTNDLVADAETYTTTLSMVLETPADADAFFIFKAPLALTITDIDCIVGAATSAVIDIQECSGTGTSCATVDAVITCDADGAADDGTFSNGGIDAGDWVKLDIGTVTGTVGHVAITVTFTYND